MAVPLVVAACLGAVFCLTPVAIYLSWVGAVNRRPRPTVLAGGWDFAALLFALSGFILFGGGLVVAALQSNARAVARGNWEQVRAVWGHEQTAWLSVAVGYFAVVLGLATAGLLVRRRTLAVYNAGPAAVEAAVEGALADAGQSAARFGNVWANDKPLVEVATVHSLRHATVAFVTRDRHLRQELDRRVRARLADARGDNPAGGWFGSIAAMLTVAVVCAMLLLAYYTYLISR